MPDYVAYPTERAREAAENIFIFGLLAYFGLFSVALFLRPIKEERRNEFLKKTSQSKMNMTPLYEKRHLQYNSIIEWMEMEQVPVEYYKLEDEELRNRYINEHNELRQHLFDKHLKTLTEKEQKLFEKGKHPSQSHKFKDKAESYAKALEKELSDLDFIEKVSLGFYHCDRIVLTVIINREISREEYKMIPWLYKGFETKSVYANN